MRNIKKIFCFIRNFLDPSLSICFYIIFFFTSFFLFAKTPFYIHRIDADSYPEISIHLKNKIGTVLDREKIIIQEKYKQKFKIFSIGFYTKNRI